MIMNVFFKLLYSLNKIMIPKPELTKRPANKAPNDNVPDKYSSLTKTLEAQFGIIPIMDVNKGAQYLFEDMKLLKLSCPTKPIIKPKARLITKTYAKIFKE